MEQTISALYRDHDIADLVRHKLTDAGLSAGDISLIPDEANHSRNESGRQDYENQISKLSLPKNDTRTFVEAVNGGDHLVSVRADDSNHDIRRIREIMENPETAQLDDTRRVGGETVAAESGQTRLPEVEERLNVGKREVEQDRVQVGTHTREEEVEEAVRLRRENVEVQRRDVAGEERLEGADAEDAFRERTVEVTETVEEPVVEKTAVKTGEVVVEKDVETDERTVSDTVRKTEVDVDRGR